MTTLARSWCAPQLLTPGRPVATCATVATTTPLRGKADEGTNDPSSRTQDRWESVPATTTSRLASTTTSNNLIRFDSSRVLLPRGGRCYGVKSDAIFTGLITRSAVHVSDISSCDGMMRFSSL